jgi:hypothetical protein
MEGRKAKEFEGESMKSCIDRKTLLRGVTNEHEFQNFLIECIPPEFTRIKCMGDIESYVNSLSAKKYEIRCKYCGQTPQEVKE